MRTNLRFIAGGLVIVAAVAYLMYAGIRETSAYYFTIDEFLTRRDSLAEAGVRVAGRVRAGSIDYDPKTLHLRFEMGRFEENAPPGAVLPVAFTGIKPDMFAEGRDVIVEGRYSDGTLRADKVLTACPSKYEAKLEPGGAADAG